jgi:hypothetical protein
MPDSEVRFLLSRSSGDKQADRQMAISFLNYINLQIPHDASICTTDKKLSTSIFAIEFRFQNP